MLVLALHDNSLSDGRTTFMAIVALLEINLHNNTNAFIILQDG